MSDCLQRGDQRRARRAQRIAERQPRDPAGFVAERDRRLRRGDRRPRAGSGTRAARRPNRVAPTDSDGPAMVPSTPLAGGASTMPARTDSARAPPPRSAVRDRMRGALLERRGEREACVARRAGRQ